MDRALSSSVSSFATIAGNATSEQWRKMLSLNWERAAMETASLEKDAAPLNRALRTQEKIKPIPPAAGLLAGVKHKICSRCKERPTPSPKKSWCSECWNAYQRDYQKQRRAIDRRNREILKGSGLA